MAPHPPLASQPNTIFGQLLQVMGVGALEPTCQQAEYAEKAVALFGSAGFRTEAVRHCHHLLLQTGAVVADLQRVCAHPNLRFDFTNGVTVPHLWMALRPVSHPKTSNRM